MTNRIKYLRRKQRVYKQIIRKLRKSIKNTKNNVFSKNWLLKI